MFRFFNKREAIKKYLLIFFLGVVSIGMVVLFIPPPVPGGSDANALANDTLAQINGNTITTADLQHSLQAQLRNSQVGFNAALAAQLAGPTLDQLILDQALRAQAAKLGIEVTPAEILRAAQAVPGLYPNGVFIGRDRFEQETGMTLSQFESQIRDSLLNEKMRDLVTDGIEVSPAEVHAEFLRRNTKAKIDYVVFDPSQMLNDVKVDPAALEAYYKSNQQRYQIPEQRKARYVLIDDDHVRAQVKISDSDLQQYYQNHLSDYRVPDRVKVAHILFKTTGKTPAEVAAIQKTAADVLAQIKAGKDFGQLAKQYSEDTSAAQGGEIGWIVHGQTVKEFDQAAFSMKPGEVSGLIKTIYGIHIIKVEDKQTAHLETFDEVKDSIRSELESEKLETARETLSDDLEHQFSQHPNDFNAIAAKAGLEPKETPLFSFKQTVPDFGNSEAFQNLAFQLRPLEVGTPISVPKGTAIIQLTEIVAAHVGTFDEVHARVEEDYRAAQSKVLAQQKANEFAAKTKAGDFKAVAKAMKLTVKESKDFAQQDYVEGLGSGSALSGAFTLAPGQTSGVVSVGGNSAVFQVVSHTAANEADFAGQKDQIEEQLREQKQSAAFEIYREELKQQMLRSGELKLNAAAMKQFIASYQQTND